MASPAEDMRNHAEEAGVPDGVDGLRTFIGTKPDRKISDASLVYYDAGGSEHLFEAGIDTASVRIMATHEEYRTCWAIVEAVRDWFFELVGGFEGEAHRYLGFWGAGTPQALGRDENNDHQITTVLRTERVRL